MSESWEVGKLLSVTEDFFRKHGIDSARLDAEVLLADTLDLSREHLVGRRERRLTDIELSSFREHVRLRAVAKPVAYLVHHKEFYSLPFYVDESVLIPRPETELLVELALNWSKSEVLRSSQKRKRTPAKEDEIQICDIGTGAGCIAAAIAHVRPDVRLTATEYSIAAARIATRNISELGLLSRVRVALCDLFPLGSTETYDVIVSNPPYLSREEYDALPATIRRYEPHLALTDGGDGGTLYRRILRSAGKRLKPDGVLFLEVSPRIAAEFEAGRIAHPDFRLVAVHKDLAGLPRVAQFQPAS